MSEHGRHCAGCRELALVTDLGEALAAAKAAYEALPESRRAELNARFDLAAARARFQAEYRRSS